MWSPAEGRGPGHRERETFKSAEQAQVTIPWTALCEDFWGWGLELRLH